MESEFLAQRMNGEWVRCVDAALAVELLAALKLLHANCDEYQRINHLHAFNNHDMQMARAAIAKAEGGSHE